MWLVIKNVALVLTAADASHQLARRPGQAASCLIKNKKIKVVNNRPTSHCDAAKLIVFCNKTFSILIQHELGLRDETQKNGSEGK